MRRSNEHASASRKADFPLGREQRIESGDTAFSYYRNIHPTHDRGLLLGSKVPGKIAEVVCFIDGACGREDEIRRVFKELLCLLVECLAASSNAIMIREHNGIGIRPGYRCGTPLAITLVKDLKQIGQHQITNRCSHRVIFLLIFSCDFSGKSSHQSGCHLKGTSSPVVRQPLEQMALKLLMRSPSAISRYLLIALHHLNHQE